MDLNLMTTQSTALILGLAPAAALATDLISIAWLVFLGTAKASATPNSFGPELLEPDNHLVKVACLGDRVTGAAMSQEQTVTPA